MDIIQASNSLAVLRFPLKIAMLASLSVLLMVMTFGCGTSDPIAQENASGQASSAGIQVHGDWVITVRNPDGEIASTYEFENELAAYGPALLMNLLAGSGKIENYNLSLGMRNAICVEGEIIVPPNNQYGLARLYLPASMTVDYYPPESLMLSSFCSVSTIEEPKAKKDGIVSYDLLSVGTTFRFPEEQSYAIAPPNADPVMAARTDFSLTLKSLEPDVAVVNGQKIALNVKLTFD